MELNNYDSGHGYSSGYGEGYSSGDGRGDGHDFDCGNGYGQSHGGDSGYGYDCGNGYGHGCGDGICYGYGYSSGDGHSYDRCVVFDIPADRPWDAFHFIQQDRDGFLRLRTGCRVEIGEPLHEDSIRMCEYGLHASLSAKMAANYKGTGAILTRVHVWGRVIVGDDKLVATDRKIVAIVG
jgi:hypothetical protein